MWFGRLLVPRGLLSIRDSAAPLSPLPCSHPCLQVWLLLFAVFSVATGGHNQAGTRWCCPKPGVLSVLP